MTRQELAIKIAELLNSTPNQQKWLKELNLRQLTRLESALQKLKDQNLLM